MEIHFVGASLFHEEGQTGKQADGLTVITKLIAAFRSVANSPKNGFFCLWEIMALLYWDPKPVFFIFMDICFGMYFGPRFLNWMTVGISYSCFAVFSEGH